MTQRTPLTAAQLVSHLLDGAVTVGLGVGAAALTLPQLGPLGAVGVGAAVSYTASAFYIVIVPGINALRQVAAIQMMDRRRHDEGEEESESAGQLLSGMRGRSPRAPIGFAQPSSRPTPDVVARGD